MRSIYPQWFIAESSGNQKAALVLGGFLSESNIECCFVDLNQCHTDLAFGVQGTVWIGSTALEALRGVREGK